MPINNSPKSHSLHHAGNQALRSFATLPCCYWFACKTCINRLRDSHRQNNVHQVQRCSAAKSYKLTHNAFPNTKRLSAIVTWSFSRWAGHEARSILNGQAGSMDKVEPVLSPSTARDLVVTLQCSGKSGCCCYTPWVIIRMCFLQPRGYIFRSHDDASACKSGKCASRQGHRLG